MRLGGAASGRMPSGRAVRASGKAGASGRGGGEAPRVVVTGMEGLEALFRAPEIYPTYSPGTVQAMHSGEARAGGWLLAAGGWGPGASQMDLKHYFWECMRPHRLILCAPCFQYVPSTHLVTLAVPEAPRPAPSPSRLLAFPSICGLGQASCRCW